MGGICKRKFQLRSNMSKARRALNPHNRITALQKTVANYKANPTLTASQVYFESLRPTSLPKVTKPKKPPSGRIIVSASSAIRVLTNVSTHSKICPEMAINFDNLARRGLRTSMNFKCSCGWEVSLCSDTGDEQHPINNALAWACMNTPLGFEDHCTFLTSIDVQPSSWHSYKKNQDSVGVSVVEASRKSQVEAGQEEKRLAIEAGDFVNVGGVTIPKIEVIVDGGWAKRTYGHGYDSNYGLAVIIGARTGKVLFIGIRRKYCYICTKWTNLNLPIPTHRCSKNWDGKSTAMEASILLEGFESSIGQHQVVYFKFVGDGDSSVYATVKHVYQGIEVQKVECINHLIRNMNCGLRKISGNDMKNKWIIPQDERRIPGMASKFASFAKLIRKGSRHYNERDDVEHDWPALQDDINNFPLHVFGSHHSCKEYYCDAIGTEEPCFANYEKLIIFQAVKGPLERPHDNAKSIIERKNSNIAESFMGCVAKSIEGKRKNLGGRFLYDLRVAGAVLSFNTSKFWAADALKILSCGNPNPLWAKNKSRAERRRVQPSKTKKSIPPRVTKFNFLQEKGDRNYGPNATNPDIPDAELRINILKLKKNLSVNEDRRNEIELCTRNQASNCVWFAERKKRLTASNAGKISKRKAKTSNTSILKQLLGHTRIRGNGLQYVQYGKDHEDVAFQAYIALKGFSPGVVTKAGFVVSMENGIFGASPDGFVGLDGILEIKCPFTMQDSDPSLWHLKKGSPLRLVNGELEMFKRHDHYYQVVQQLHVTGRSWCDYFVWTKKGSLCIRIHRSETFDLWKKMKATQEKFWMCDLAPELVNSRLDRGYLQCRPSLPPSFFPSGQEEEEAME